MNKFILGLLREIIALLKSPAYADDPVYRDAVHRLTLVVMTLEDKHEDCKGSS